MLRHFGLIQRGDQLPEIAGAVAAKLGAVAVHTVRFGQSPAVRVKPQPDDASGKNKPGGQHRKKYSSKSLPQTHSGAKVNKQSQGTNFIPDDAPEKSEIASIPLKLVSDFYF